MELDFDKYCVVDGSPTTVLPGPRRHSNRKSNGNPKCGNYTSTLGREFAEISFNRYRSTSCRDARSRRSTREGSGSERPKRGSVYQSSKEVMHLRKEDTVVERKKIEFSRGSASTSSFGIIDSLCSSDEDSERNRSSVMSLSEQSTSSFCENQAGLRTQRKLRQSSSKPPTGRLSVQDLIRTSESAQVGSSINLHKLLSAKLALSHSPTHSESDGSKANSPKVRVNPSRKPFDPFVKSKSDRSPLSCVNEARLETVNCNEPICGKTNENPNPVAPAHLHGLLKLETKQGLPVFEFSVKSPDDIYIAKTWKAENAPTWTYTFHSHHPRRKSNASGWGFKDSNRESAMIGQMKVSCYLCKELKGDRSFSDSVVTEFVLYDITHLRNNSHTDCSPNVSKVSPVPDDPSTRSAHENHEASGSQPLAAVELHPELEVAAMVVQIPFVMRASLKFESDELDKEISNATNPGNMHVVIPEGNHSLPSNETCGPSPLLDRWRLGGGCSCGGWDMACPLHVFVNPNFHVTEDNQGPTGLFVQGKKDNVPAFSMRRMEGEKYMVDFHAQLSSLQAFAICVAILHCADATSGGIGIERAKRLLQSDSLRVFPDDEIKSSIDGRGDEEKFTCNKRMEEVAPYFVINPPFSPIGRV